jgi:hypothetical protein
MWHSRDVATAALLSLGDVFTGLGVAGVGPRRLWEVKGELVRHRAPVLEPALVAAAMDNGPMHPDMSGA